MQMRSEPLDSDVPFFPFPLRAAREPGQYRTTGHRRALYLQINRQAAEILRYADGATPLGVIVDRLARCYPRAGGPAAIRAQALALLRPLSARDMIWWRDRPLEPATVGPPESMFLEITAACNLCCRHCVVGAGAKLRNELPTERWLSLIDELAAYGVTNVAFSGGEPLAHPELRRLVERARAGGMSVQIATNGTLVTPAVARWLREQAADVQVSLDGSCPAIHEAMRLGSDAFARTVAGIKALVDAGLAVTVGTVVTRLNLADIPAIMRLCAELGAAAFRPIPFVPAGRGGHSAALDTTPREMLELTRMVSAARAGAALTITSMEFEEILEGGCPSQQATGAGRGCSGALAYGTITPTGDLLPCHFFSGVRADSVAQRGFVEVWLHSRFLNYFRQLSVADFHGDCPTCPFVGRCGGSCRARNFAQGDLLGSNPACWARETGLGEVA